ncbi:hypothetical protein [Vibrio sp. St2]|uniref:hypothetical protein n=1 Tax=Vibrio sp. St2 TaxID=2853441 RepID=UPI00248F457F|nr:hypothetical protein [Vibrio sp. St2]
MEIPEAGNLFFGMIASIGTVVATLYNFGQVRKINAELLASFEIALEKQNKHSVTELFRSIHGLRMNYSDIVVLVNDDNCSKIIYALKKTPGMVSFEGGKFQYSGLGKIRPFMAFDKLLRGAGLVLAIGLFVISFWLLAFGNSGESIAGMILIVPSSFFIALSIRTNRYDKMVRSLVGNEH